MRKSLGSKRREIGHEDIAIVTRLFGDCIEAQMATVYDAEGTDRQTRMLLEGEPEPAAPEGGKVKLRPLSLLLPNKTFGYRQITVERPARDERGASSGRARQGQGQAAARHGLRDTESVPLTEDVEAYFEREVLPHAPDAWIDEDKTRVGYEIPFNRHFYVFEPPRELAEIDADLRGVTQNIQRMLTELAA